MSLYFEDICSVIPNRAVDEDDDDVDDGSFVDGSIYLPVIRWSQTAQDHMATSGDHRLCCNLLVLAIGPVASGFVSTFLLGKSEVETVGVVCSGMRDSVENTLSQRSSVDSSCFILSLVQHPGTICILCNSDIQQEHTFLWVNQLLSKVCSSTTHVSVLASNNTTNYKTSLPPDDLPRNFLRCISSSAFHGLPNCPVLEQPNIVSGLPAQVVSYCQVHAISCVLYMSYSAASSPEVETFQSFLPILKSPPFRGLANPVPDADKKIAELVAQRTRSTGQLYI